MQQDASGSAGIGRAIQLDAVRGIAILLAMGWHLNGRTGVPVADMILAPGRSIGWAGVDLFFVLSGFLVGRLILIEIRDSGTFDYRTFLIRRVFRLWPVLYLYVAAVFFLTDRHWLDFVPQVFLHVQNYFRTDLNALWSLAVEEHFYLLAGLGLPFLTRRKAAPRTYVIILVALMIAPLLLRIMAVWLGVDRVSIQWQTHYRVDALACGVLLAVLSVYYHDAFLAIARRKLALIALCLTGFALLVPMGVSEWRSTLGYTIAYLASAAAVLFAHDLRYSRLMQPVMVMLAFLGIYSYSIYIWHFSLASTAEKVLDKVGLSDPLVTVCVGYGVAILGAWVISRLVEMPMIRLRNRLFPSPAHSDPVQVERDGGMRRAAT